jgi:LacI family transcriptional regulator
MTTDKRRKRSPRFVEIAAEAGVSPATVDRVLNERGSASEQARRKVISAAQKLGVPRILPSPAHELIHLDVLLPDNRSPFFLRLRNAVASACAFLDKRIVVHRRVMPDGDHAALARAIARPNHRRRGLIVAAPDTAEVRAALREACERGEVVASVASDVADVPDIAYFGIDNYRAGRTVGLVMGRFARRPGRVMFLSGRNDWAAHKQRTAGCRDVLKEAFPQLRCETSPFETLDDDYRCYQAVADAMRGPGLAGIYNSGAGSAGIKQALEKFDADRAITWISHELSDDHRQYLESGALTMVIDQDPDMQAMSALRYLIERTAAESSQPRPLPGCEFRVYFAENVTRGLYLRPSATMPPLIRGPA